ncbi:YolD-like family protein [Cytobacillus sp. FJAT-54145]|uniref:YolD-like family protein n=1 Tax=Cytobacillus spartinae TaxID=3299023 RepID=A0ABW6KA68_9BACI
MLRDRGKMKWQGFFMPEHIRALREMEMEMKETKKPLLDEYEMQEMNETIQTALLNRWKVRLTLHERGFERDVEGWIRGVRTHEQILELKTEEELEKVELEALIRVQLLG